MRKRNVYALRETDELAGMNSPVHSLHPLAKLIVTIAYLLVTTSFPKYDFSGLSVMMLYPALLFAVSGIPVRTCLYRLRIVMPLVCAVGILNPFFDRTPMFAVGAFVVSGGMVSMVTLMAKGVLCLTASWLLAATTSVDAVCAALRKLHMPGLLTTLFLLTYRYLSVMAEEIRVMTMAYRLRAPGQRGIHFSAWGSFLGQALLRSMDRAEEIYSGMRLRGFCGEFRYAETRKAGWADYVFAGATPALFVLCRSVDVAGLVGKILT